MPTYTPNYSFEQPVVGGDVNLWGVKINTVIGQIDTEIKSRANAISTVSSDLTTLSNATVKLDGSVTMTGMLKLPASTNPTLANHAVPKSYADSLVTGLATLASPAFTGVPTAPTAAGGTNTTQIATTAFVTGALGSYLPSATAASTYAPLASPTLNNATLTGVPVAPTATAGTNTTQIATTAFVTGAIANLPVAETALLLTTDQTATTATFAANPTLSIPMAAGGIYEFEAALIVTAPTTGSAKIGLGVTGSGAAPQGASGVVWNSALNTLNLIQSMTNTFPPATNWSSTAVLTFATVIIKGKIFANATNGGTLQIFFAQNTANASASRLRAGSTLKYRRTV